MCDKLINVAESDCLSPLDVSAFMSEDLEDLCRLCMASEKTHSGLEMVGITEKYPNSDTLIPSLFFDVLQINVDESTSPCMPQKACMACLGKLFSFSDFKKQSLCIDAKLRQIVHQKQKIAEAQALYGPIFSDLGASYSASSAPDFFETDVGQRPDIGVAAFPPAEDVGNIPQEVLCSDVPEVEGSWKDSSVTKDSESNVYGSTNLPTICNARDTHKDIKSSAGVVSSFSSDGTIALDTGMATCSKNQIQFTDDTLCPDIICEIIVPESNSTEEDPFDVPVDVVPDSVDVYEVCSLEDSANTSEAESSDSIKKINSTRLPVPEVFVIEGEQAEKQLGFRCPICKRVFHSNIEFRKHASLHVKSKGGGICKYCDKWFQTSNALLRHYRVHSGEKPFLCILCDRSFSQREILQRHIMTHTDTKPYQCQQCDKSYAQKSGLESHVKHHHQPTVEISQYPCVLCDKAFCHPSGLTRHMLTHSGKQYVCEVCNRKFSDSSSLRRHSKNIHHVLP